MKKYIFKALRALKNLLKGALNKDEKNNEYYLNIIEGNLKLE